MSKTDTTQSRSGRGGVSEGAPIHGNPTHLIPPSTLQRLVAGWLDEDTPDFDYGGFVVGEGPVEARLLGKSAGIVAGVPFFDEVFRQLGCEVQWHVREGTRIEPVTHCATVRGPVRRVLLGERVALNTLARCSGIATKSNHLLHLIRTHNSHTLLSGTRKTTPGFRLPEKHAMLVGGIDTHRHSLSTMTMLKDNHIWACGGDISRAVRAAKSAGGFAVKVEVECQSEAEAEEAVRAGADVVMLDNFDADELKTAVASLKSRLGKEGFNGFLIEVSGGLTEENVAGYVCEGVDVVSSSSVHQGVKHVDFSLKVVPVDGKSKGAAAVNGEGEGSAV